MDLIEFLRARLDEDELIAQDAAEVHLGWPREKRGHWIAEIDGIAPYLGYLKDREVLTHVALHDPARVLRDVEAKRAILDLAAQTPPGYATAVAGTTLRLLADVYADHPDYDPAWAITVTEGA